MVSRTRWIPLALSLTLLLGLGAVGLWLVRAGTEASETGLGEGAIEKQRTVALLTDQYLKIAAKDVFDLGVAGQLELTPGSTADATVLRDFLGRPAGFFDHGAVLATLTGERLTVVGDVPPPNDPGFVPLRSSLLRGEPGVSSVMEVDGSRWSPSASRCCSSTAPWRSSWRTSARTGATCSATASSWVSATTPSG